MRPVRFGPVGRFDLVGQSALCLTQSVKPSPMSLTSANSVVSRQLLDDMRRDLSQRRIRHGLARLNDQENVFELSPDQEHAAAFVGYCAQWVDAGFRDAELVRTLLARFPEETRADLPLVDYAHLRLAEGFVAGKDEALPSAIRHFEFVLGIEDALSGTKLVGAELLAAAHYWKANCHRKAGEYDEALASALKGRKVALGLGYFPMAAIIQSLEGWLLFQKGRASEAFTALNEAEAVLRQTDDYITVGNILSTYGRIDQADGRYEESVRHFAAAISEYAKVDAQHPNVARTLGNMAYVKRLMARQLRRRIDASAALRRQASGDGGETPRTPVAEIRTRFEQLQREALSHLDEADAIFGKQRQRRGEGNLKITYGHIFLDNGDLDRAEEEATGAYELGLEKEDHILMARARLLRCMVENARLEDDVLEDADQYGDASRHAGLAEKFGLEAVECAKHTQNDYLLARAYIWLGLTQSNEYFNNLKAARHSLNLAMSSMKADPFQPHWDDLETLKTRVLRGGDIDETLRAWSQGAVGDKTFREITDEFAELIIPKIWLREDRKIARVAKKLSISPKKVRRVLMRAGVLDHLA
jgi:tetratricopeptide (TPR) repeat protein